MVRRVVTGTDSEGRSVFSSDEELAEVVYKHTPGFKNAWVWTTTAPLSPQQDQPTGPPASFVPGPGGTVAMTVTFPPDSVFFSPDFDPAAAGEESLRNTPGLAELFEQDAPGMHTTPTVDYAIVLDGSVVLELDDGAVRTLNVGDFVVQNGTRHAWRVPSDKPATLFFVLMGRAR